MSGTRKSRFTKSGHRYGQHAVAAIVPNVSYRCLASNCHFRGNLEESVAHAVTAQERM